MPNFGTSRLGYWFNNGPGLPSITGTTEVNIYGDSSGSMDLALDTLQSMVSTGALKNALLSTYGTEANYNQRVRFATFYDERTFAQFQTPKRLVSSTQVINVIVQDEFSPIYANYEGFSYETAYYDIGRYKTYLLSQPEYTYKSVLIPVNGFDSYSAHFYSSMLAAFNGTGASTRWPASWKNAFAPSTRTWRNVMGLGSLLAAEATENDFVNAIVQGLNRMGFN